MASLKKQFAALESSLGSQSTDLTNINDRMDGFESIIGPAGSGLSDVVTEILNPVQAKIMDMMGEMKEEMDHKFSLQGAENKRMSQHLSTSKRENQALKLRLVALEERVKNLEIELGGEEYDEKEEEEDVKEI
ncbi:hypothetical protein ScalyP_jg11491 [Parmales sp. scaly parma]|jgi:hypothetical protein|nr:hypothetical protein ScalyP_jg11491 [Parmales sp. scaly parma]|tara:strand:- start:508 stop:906 length:399 start_codon:yes stop_codon:yes gene_type:complete